MITLTIVFLVLLTAPWFFMMARIKNMGYTRRDVRRFVDDFGPVVGTLTLTSLVIGVVSDVLFNVIIGSIIFRELPREFLFTGRVKRWAKEYDKVATTNKDAPLVARMPNYREECGDLWRERLNNIMAGHV